VSVYVNIFTKTLVVKKERRRKKDGERENRRKKKGYLAGKKYVRNIINIEIILLNRI